MKNVQITREKLQPFKEVLLSEFPGITPYHMDDAIAALLGFDDGEALNAALDRAMGTIIVPEFYPDRFNRRLREVPSYPWINPDEPMSAPSNRGKRKPTLEGAMRGVQALLRLVEQD